MTKELKREDLVAGAVLNYKYPCEPSNPTVYTVTAVGREQALLTWTSAAGKEEEWVESIRIILRDYALVVPKEVIYINVYPKRFRSGPGRYTFQVHRGKGRAEYHAQSDRVACIRLEYTEGQFDE